MLRRRMVPLLVVVFAGCSTPTKTAVITSKPADAAALPISGAGDIKVTRVGHASVLLDFGGPIVLTDPWFTETPAYRVGEPLAMQVEDLPKLAAIIASHDHYDHFDVDALKVYRDKSVPLIVAPGAGEHAREGGFTDVRELKPWEATKVGDLEITAAPGAHGVPEITFLVRRGDQTVYFGGDSKMIPELDEIPKRFPSIQLALLSVNGLTAMRMPQVMNAKEAAELTGKMHAEVAVPIHYRFKGSWFTDTFILGYHGTPEEYAEHCKTTAPTTAVRLLEPGQLLELKGSGSNAAPAAQP